MSLSLFVASAANMHKHRQRNHKISGKVKVKQSVCRLSRLVEKWI
jgi:hypothetical protein